MDFGTGVAAIMAGVLIFSGQAGELAFGPGSDAQTKIEVAAWGIGIVALVVAVWRLGGLVTTRVVWALVMTISQCCLTRARTGPDGAGLLIAYLLFIGIVLVGQR